MNHDTLCRAVQTLSRIDQAGLLSEYRLDVAEATRGPADDLERHVDKKWAIHRSTKLASQLFCVSKWQAEQAAKEALLPTTRRSIALKILAEYEARLDAEEAERAARRSVSAFNRRRGA